MFRLGNSLRPLISSRSIQTSRTALGFFSNLKEELKEGAKKEGLDKDLKESQLTMAEYREKMKKEQLEKFGDSEKFKKLKKQTASYEEKITEKLSDTGKTIKDKVGIDIGKETGKILDGIQNFEFTQKPTDRMDVFKEDFETLSYQPPTPRPRKNIDENHKTVDFEADDQTTGVHVHKDWVLYEKLKNSGLGKRMDEFGNKMKSSESNMIRGGIWAGERFASKVNNMFTNEFNHTIKTIRKMEPDFSQDNFILFLEKEMIPIILEAGALNDKEIVDDWCFDAASQKLLGLHLVAKKGKMVYYEKTLSLGKIELVKGEVNPDGTPAIYLNFETNKCMTFTDKDGKVIDTIDLMGGGAPQPDHVYKTYHSWIVVRDMMEPEPAAAWRVMDLESHATKLLF